MPYLTDGDLVLPVFLATAVQLPLLGAMVMLLMASDKKQYARVSLLLKLIAAAGVVSMLFYKIPL
jgi:hypothetical protein